MASPVLIVDDDGDFRRTMARALELNGYRVDAVGSGEEAIQIARERECQVAFIDVKMPEMDGLETYLKLREVNSSIRTVMMTGYGDEVTDIVARAMAAKVTTCLHKPFDLSQAVDLIGATA